MLLSERVNAKLLKTIFRKLLYFLALVLDFFLTLPKKTEASK